MSMVKIMLVANAGIMIEYNSQQILIDALHEGHRLFPATPPEAIRQLLDGKPPFKSIGPCCSPIITSTISRHR